MGVSADPMRQGPRHDADGRPGNTAEGDERIDELRAGLEQTRAEMSETIDAIQERASSEHVRKQILGSVQDAAVSSAKNMASSARQIAQGAVGAIRTIVKQRPLLSSSIGLLFGWLVLRGLRGAARR